MAKKKKKEYQTGTRKSLKADKRIKAKPPGKRKSKSGKAYTERRKNRSDKRGTFAGAPNKNNNLLLWILFGIGVAFVVFRKRTPEDETEKPYDPASAYGGYSTNGLPRGIANKNPLNLALSNENWQGKIPNSNNTDFGNPRLEQFTSLPYGIRANLLNIVALVKAKGGTKGIVPIKELISYWGTGKGGLYGTNASVTNYVDHVIKKFNENGYPTVKPETGFSNPLTSGAALSKIQKDFWLLFTSMAEFENGLGYASTIKAMKPDFDKALTNLATQFKLT